MPDSRTLLSEILRTAMPAVEAATPLRALTGFDSLAMVNLVLKLESAIDRELTESEMETLQTVGDVERLLEAR